MTNHRHIPPFWTWRGFGESFRPILDHAKDRKISTSLLLADNGLNGIIGSLGSLTARKTGSHEKGKSWDFGSWWLLRHSWHSRGVVAQQDKKKVRGSDDTTSA